jgi:hypothetical protein
MYFKMSSLNLFFVKIRLMKKIHFIIICLFFSACFPGLEKIPTELWGLSKIFSSSSLISIQFIGSPYTFTQNSTIAKITPIVQGSVNSCGSKPNLPAGLILNINDCSISGTPTTLQSATNYTITAWNGNENVSTVISIAITTLPTVNTTNPLDASVVSINGLNLSVTFSNPMNTATITVNTTDTACTGAIQVSNNNFASCIRMLSLPTPSGGNMIFTFTPHSSNPIFANASGYKFKVTVGAQDIYGNFLAVQYLHAVGFSTNGLVRQYAFTAGAYTDQNVANALTPISAPSTVRGKDGDASGAFLFNGTTQYFTGSIVGLPSGAGPRTLCTWVNPGNLPSLGQYSMFVNYGISTVSQSFGLYQTNNAGTHQIGLSAFGDDLIANATLPVNTWSHLCGTYDGTTARLYLNGQQMIAGPKSYATTLSYFIIGAQSGPSQFVNGKMDDVQIYDVELPPLQIRKLATQVPVASSAVFDFQSDELDISGNQNSLAAIGPPVLTNDRFGFSAGAYSFNGASKFSTATPVTTVLSNVTLSAWIRPTSFAGSNLQVILVNGSGGDGYGILIDHANSGTGCAPINVLSAVLGGIGYICSTVVPPLNVWTHVALRATATDWELLMNGVVVGSLLATAPNLPTTGTFIGSDSTANFFTGDIDSVRIDPSALSNSQIISLSGYHPMQVNSWNSNPAISTLKLFYQANSQPSPGAITTWNDNSGSTNNLTSGTNVSAVAVGINGKPSIDLNSTSSYFTNNAPVGLNGMTKYAFYATLNPTTTTGTYQTVMNVVTVGGCPALYPQFHMYQTGMGAGFCGGSNSWTAGGTVNVGNNYIVSVNWNNIVGGPYFNLYNFYVNGSNSLGSGGYAGTAGTANQIFVGNVAASFNGLLGDIILFRESLDFSTNTIYGAPWNDHRIVECFLSSKYNIGFVGGQYCP